MANTDDAFGFRFEAVKGGGAAPIIRGTLKSNVDVAKGDVLALETTGKVDLAAATQSPIAGVAAEAITGAATATSEILMYDVGPDVVFSVQMDSLAAQTDVGESFDMIASTGAYELDSSTSDGSWRVVDLKPETGNAWGSHAVVLAVCEESAWYGTA
jgi:hypothetical protein